GADDAHPGERARETVELGVPHCRDPLGPRVERLEEVVGRAVAEGRVSDPDVNDGRLRPGPVEIEKETQLPLAAPQREARSGPAQHGRSVAAGAELSGTAPPKPSTKQDYGPHGQPPVSAGPTIEPIASRASLTRAGAGMRPTSLPWSRACSR